MKRRNLSWMLLAAASLLISSLPVCLAQGLIKLPDGQAPDGSGQSTAYQCEGEELRFSCNEDETIQVIRANFGRFSISICNRHGITDWSVNCMAPASTRILEKRCNGKRECEMSVNSRIFGQDPCPGTQKYVEVHYKCRSNRGGDEHSGDLYSASNSHRPRPTYPPWLSGNHRAAGIWQENEDLDDDNDDDGGGDETLPFGKPILVHGIDRDSDIITTTSPPKRIPITTPKRPKTTSTTTTTFAPAVFVNEAAQHVSESATTFPSASSVSFAPGSACPPKMSRRLHWNWTRTGESAIQPCPRGASGLAKWQCRPDAAWEGDRPDFSDCKSSGLEDLESRVRQSEREEDIDIVSKLEELTSSSSFSSSNLYGGDIQAAVNVLKTIADRLQYEMQRRNGLQDELGAYSHVRQIVERTLNVADNLLSPQNHFVWEDLSDAIRSKLASSLASVVETHAFLLAEVITSEQEVAQQSREIAMTASVIDTADKDGPIPRRQWSGKGNDSIEVPNAALRSFAHPRIRAVFLSFESIHELLSPGYKFVSLAEDPRRFRVNSRVLALTLDRQNLWQESNRRLPEPVTIRLHHLRHDPNGRDRECVFWNVVGNAWSNEGCNVVTGDSDVTVCECNHLTSFAVLEAATATGDNLLTGGQVSVVASNDPDDKAGLTLLIVICLVAAAIVLVTILVAVKFRREIGAVLRKSSCCRSCCFCRERSLNHQIADKKQQKKNMKRDVICINNGNGGINNATSNTTSHVVPDDFKMRLSTDTIPAQGHPLLPRPPRSGPAAGADNPFRTLGNPGTTSLQGGLNRQTLHPRQDNFNSSSNRFMFDTINTKPLHQQQQQQQSEEDLSTLPRTTLRRPQPRFPQHQHPSPQSQSPLQQQQQQQQQLIVNPFVYHSIYSPPVDNYQAASASSPASPARLRSSTNPRLLHRLAQNWRLNSNNPRQMSTAAAEPYETENLYWEISSPNPGGQNNAGGSINTLSTTVEDSPRRLPPVNNTNKKRRNYHYGNHVNDLSDEETDVHNITDFSDEDEGTEGQSSSSSSGGKRKGRHYPTPPPRRTTLRTAAANSSNNYQSFDLLSSNRVTNI